MVDVIQGGAGTSTNMNANEVIANRAVELLGRRRGEYQVVHPNNHVNLSQSTNDVYPTAIKIAAHWAIEDLRRALGELSDAFREKGREFAEVLKMGRTQLQDAVPMTLGQEFTAFAVTIEEDIERLGEAAALIREINMGATAIGTGINTDPRYAAVVRERLTQATSLELKTAPDLVEATQDTGAFVQLSGVLKRVAVKLSKICNDLTITMAAEAGQLQLNVFEPVIAFKLLQSMDMLARGTVVLRERCVVGITANRERLRRMVEDSIGLVTALVPYLGYERSSQVAKEALETGRGVYELVREKGWLSQERLDEILTPEAMTRPRPLPMEVG